jgi:hypothetical protein
MIDKINELIEKYTLYAEESENYKGVFELVEDALAIINKEVVSDLEELKKLVEKKSKLTDLVDAQQPMPAEFKKVVDENFWELVEDKK